LLVVGKDVKGRGQYLYSEKFKASQQAKKFARVKELSKKFAAIKKENDANRKRSETRDQADLTALIMSTGIRPGGESNTKADKKAYGATTLQARHVTTVRGVVHLRFVGKKGVALNIPVHDESIAKMLLKRKDAANENLDRLFTTSASELSAYSNSLDGGGFKTKDFRTCLGTSVALEHIATMDAPTSAKEYKSHLKAVATAVSERLGNTPAIALASYINPTVFEGWKGDWA
jgi:DNA topoisomerase-1